MGTGEQDADTSALRTEQMVRMRVEDRTEGTDGTHQREEAHYDAPKIE
jgi:hypothetical protein